VNALKEIADAKEQERQDHRYREDEGPHIGYSQGHSGYNQGAQGSDPKLRARVVAWNQVIAISMIHR